MIVVPTHSQHQELTSIDYIFFVINKPKRSQEHELLTRHKTLAPSWGFLTIVITLPSSAVTVAHIKPGHLPPDRTCTGWSVQQHVRQGLLLHHPLDHSNDVLMCNELVQWWGAILLHPRQQRWSRRSFIGHHDHIHGRHPNPFWMSGS